MGQPPIKSDIMSDCISPLCNVDGIIYFSFFGIGVNLVLFQHVSFRFSSSSLFVFRHSIIDGRFPARTLKDGLATFLMNKVLSCTRTLLHMMFVISIYQTKII